MKRSESVQAKHGLLDARRGSASEPDGNSGIVLAAVIAVVAVILGALYLPRTDLRPASTGLSHDESISRLRSLVALVDWRERYTTRVAPVALEREKDISATLPDIEEFPVVVRPLLADGDVAVEIMSTTHLSRDGNDGLQAEIARAFNQSDQRLHDGRAARVLIRQIPSGIAYSFITSGKYVTDAFNPVHGLWAQMATAKGVTMSPIRRATVRSVGGVVVKKSTHAELLDRHGRVDLETIVDEVARGDLAMGYTNPFASSTGLDFLVTVLSTYSRGDHETMLSPTVVSAFEQFQRGVPFVAMTTLHMRESVRDNGSLDAFIMGNRTFFNTPELRTRYAFIPFGVGHDHPLYAVGDLSPDKLEVLELFARFSEQTRFRELASSYGWNQDLAFEPKATLPPGQVLLRAQRLWKEKKHAGAPVSAVFVCDVSGSMAGARINALRRSLIGGSEFISSANSIGMVLFNNEATTVLPIKTFNLKHRGAFTAAVQDIRVGGGTAMYDGVVVGLQMLLEQRRRRPDEKLMMFVLTDGATNEGLTFKDVEPVVEALGIPIFTIGYEADLDVLRRLSSLVEATSTKASAGKVGYVIGSMFNAQM